MASRKWTITVAAAAALAVAGATAGWAAADDLGITAKTHVDGVDAVTDDFNDHVRELGGPLCDGCDASDGTDLVVLWQSILVADGFLTTENPIDGYFGPDTKRATAMWQDHFGIEQTGKADAASWAEAGSHLKQNQSTVYYSNEGVAEIRFTRDNTAAYKFNKLLTPDGEFANTGGDRIEFHQRTIKLTEL